MSRWSWDHGGVNLREYPEQILTAIQRADREGNEPALVEAVEAFRALAEQYPVVKSHFAYRALVEQYPERLAQ